MTRTMEELVRIATGDPDRSHPGDRDEHRLCVWVDHREEETWILERLGEHVAPEDAMQVEWRGDELWVVHRGASHRIPLTMSRHDRYVAIGSAAELLRDRYTLFVNTESLGSDTHGIAVVPNDELASAPAALRAAFDQHYTRVVPGTDHFHDLQVPWVGHEDHNPALMQQSQAIEAESEAVVKAVMESPAMQASMQGLRGEIAAVQRRHLWRSLLWKALAIFVAIRLLRFLFSLF